MIKHNCLLLLPLMISFIIIACEDNNEINSEMKDVSPSKEIVNNFFTIDEELYNYLTDNDEFIILSENYSRVKWELFFEKQEDKGRLDSIVRQIYLLGEKYNCKNILAYCLYHETHISKLSRITHEWGMCAIYPGGIGVCDTRKYWQNAWDICGNLELDAACELGYDKFNLAKYRSMQHDFLSVSRRMISPEGQLGNFYFVYGGLYKKLAITEDIHPKMGSLFYARNLPLNSIVSNVSSNVEYDDLICFYIAGMERVFMDFYYSRVWKNCISEGIEENTPNPEENIQNPEENPNPVNPSEDLPWNKTTHYNILDFVAKKVGFTQEELSILKDVNDWCDSFLNKNQLPSRAYLHAMNTDPNLSVNEAQKKFEDHLKDHFIDYIVEQRIDKLGIALHGIADSFCPSHTGFQYFNPFTATGTEIILHMYWDVGQHAPLYVMYAEQSMITIVNILKGNDNVAVDDTRSKEERALDAWRDAYSKIH